MNLEEYERKFALYAEFAETVQAILEQAILSASGVPRLQSIQCRAKSPSSLKPKLEKAGILAANDIETRIKDLAGARIIFYTNTDVDRFLNSRLIPENFEVDWDATKVHHPTKENASTRYQAIHYTVTMSKKRAALPEYAKFKGLRCEIQIQTILNHAWSETSHDIIYKDELPEGFGTQAMDAIRKRFERIMDEHLMPAGYDFQRIQHDFERLQQGKALFDRDAIKSLVAAADNNERHDILTNLKDYTLANYDDIRAIYNDLYEPLIGAARAARSTPLKVITTPFGEYEGKTAAEVIGLVVSIFNEYRYIEVERTFSALCELIKDETDEEVRKRVIESVGRLAHYNLGVWKQVGPQVQHALLDLIDKIPEAQRPTLRSILQTVYEEILKPEITGSSWGMKAVTMKTGALPASNQIKAVRDRALSGLIALFDQSDSDSERRRIIHTMQEATRRPHQVRYSNEFLAETLVDAKRIVDHLTQNLGKMGYELIEHVEHILFYEHGRTVGIAIDKDEKFNSRPQAKALLQSIEAFCAAANSDQTFIKYKTLVGFEGIFPPHWEEDNFEIKGKEKYRQERVAEYVAAITQENAEEWYKLIELCAATESDDMATFPMFGDFLVQLAQAQPAIARNFIERGNARVLHFLPGLLSGLKKSGAEEEYNRVLKRYLTDGEYALAVIRHFRNLDAPDMDQVRTVLAVAMKAEKHIAAIECISFTVEKYQEGRNDILDDVFTPALAHLTDYRDARWPNAVWFMDKARQFFPSLPPKLVSLVLASLEALPKVDTHAEFVLSYIASKYPNEVLQFFGRRIEEDKLDGVERYEAIPYQFYQLRNVLSANPGAVVAAARGWFNPSDQLFRFTGARFLHSLFPDFTDVLGAPLLALAEEGGDDDVSFVLDVLQNYRGEIAMHPILQAIIDHLPDGDGRFSEVHGALASTGVVGGEFGFVEAFREKKREIQPWLEDERPQVKAFAEKFIRSLDQRIAQEQRSAEQSHEHRRRDYDDGEAEE